MNQIAEGVIFGNNVKLGNNVTIKSGCVLEDNITIEDNVYIDYGVIIHSNVKISSDTFVGARCILGEYVCDFYDDFDNKNHFLSIGHHSLIRSETIIYGENKIGDYFQTGHRVTIREHSKIGEHVRIGTLSDVQGYCEIGDYVNIHSNVHIGMKSTIKNFVWLFPYVVLTNDPTPPSNDLVGVTIEEYSVVSTGSIVLPGKTIGAEALIGAGAIVTKDVESRSIAMGNPARSFGSVEKIRNPITNKKVYPWQYTFDRGMPWSGEGYENWKENQRDMD